MRIYNNNKKNIVFFTIIDLGHFLNQIQRSECDKTLLFVL